MDHLKEAIRLMMEDGLQCSQAVVAVLSKQLDLDLEQALRLSSGFGGGVAMQGDICGAVSGAIMAIGLKHGYDNGPNVEARDKVFILAQELLHRLRAKYGSYMCRTLTGINLMRPEERKLIHEQNIFGKICRNIINDSIEIVLEIW